MINFIVKRHWKHSLVCHSKSLRIEKKCYLYYIGNDDDDDGDYTLFGLVFAITPMKKKAFYYFKNLSHGWSGHSDSRINSLNKQGICYRSEFFRWGLIVLLVLIGLLFSSWVVFVQCFGWCGLQSLSGMLVAILKRKGEKLLALWMVLYSWSFFFFFSS